MKKGLKNLLLGAALALPFGCKDNPNKGIISTEYDAGVKAIVETHESRTDGKQGTISSFGNDDCVVQLNKSSIDKSVNEITTKWNFIEDNSHFDKGNKRWSSASQVAYLKLKDVKESERASVAYGMIKNATIIHEKDHIDYFKRKNGWRELDLPQIEKLAMFKEISENILGLMDVETLSNSYIRKSGNDAVTQAGYEVVRDLMDYFKKDNKYDFYHMPGFENKVKKASKELYVGLKKKNKLDY